jgi:beta-glucosidase
VKKIFQFLLTVIFPFSILSLHAQTKFDTQVEQLLKQMTLEEKVGQMTQVTLDVVSGRDKNGNVTEPQDVDQDKLKEAILKYKVGSILNVGAHGFDRKHWHEIISAIQSIAMKDSRLHIPVIYGIDAIHGVTYTMGSILFPQEIGLAATWNPQLAYDMGKITAYETRASYIPWNFSPVLDLGMSALWPRIYETLGEDPLLAKTLGAQIIKGYQGSDGSSIDKYHVAACMKHYLGYSYPKTGKDRTPSWIPDRYMREYFLPTFQEAVKTGALTVMVNSGDINGIPVHASKYLITDVLKGELKFAGLAVSDWQDIQYLATKYHIAKDFKEAGEIAVNAGIDMSMVPYDYTFADNLIQSVKEGKVTMDRIDDAVRRILKLKFQLDLWNNPIGNENDFPDFASAQHKQAALQTAVESIVLLKNQNNVLPLSKSAKILVTGPTANTMRSLDAGWSYTWQGERDDEFAKDNNTILEAIENVAGKQQVQYVKGVEFDKATEIDKAVEAAKNSDAVILCLGENTYTETPGNINDINLPDAQFDLAKAIAQTGKPVILILAEGRPRVFNKIESSASAVLLSLFTGNEGGDAIAKILFGDENPSGKLPITYPKYANSLLNYNHKPSEEWGGKESAMYDAQYDFGFGLSYTSFAYNNISVSNAELNDGNSITISVDVKNTGNREGKEVVQLYISDLVASITPDIKRLRGFEKINLKPGETKTVKFNIKKSDLEFIGVDGEPTLESGDFNIQIANQKASFHYQSSQKEKAKVYDKL